MYKHSLPTRHMIVNHVSRGSYPLCFPIEIHIKNVREKTSDPKLKEFHSYDLGTIKAHNKISSLLFYKDS